MVGFGLGVGGEVRAWAMAVGAVGAQAAEHDLHRLDGEVAALAGGDAHIGDVDEHVAHGAAARAHEVLVRVVDVGVDAHARTTGFEPATLTLAR